MIKPDFWPTLVFSNKILLICIDHWQNLLQEKSIQKSSSTLRRTSGSSKWWTTQTSAPHPLHPSAQKQSVGKSKYVLLFKRFFWRQSVQKQSVAKNKKKTFIFQTQGCTSGRWRGILSAAQRIRFGSLWHCHRPVCENVTCCILQQFHTPGMWHWEQYLLHRCYRFLWVPAQRLSFLAQTDFASISSTGASQIQCLVFVFVLVFVFAFARGTLFNTSCTI